jgi:hypothetical protein
LFFGRSRFFSIFSIIIFSGEQMLEKDYAKILLKSGTSLSGGEVSVIFAAMQHCWVANYSCSGGSKMPGD